MTLFTFPYIYLLLIAGTAMYLFSTQIRNVLKQLLTKITTLKPQTIGLLFAFLTFLFALLEITDGHNWGDDYAQYIAQARALATNTIPAWLEKSIYTYSMSTASGLGTVVYPWGESLLLTPLYQIFGMNYVAFKIEGILFLALAMYVLYFVFLEVTEKRTAIVLTLFCALNTGYLTYANEIYADYPCLFFTFVAIYYVLRYLKNRTWKYAVLIGTFGFCAYLCRSLAFSVLAALGCMDLLYAYHTLSKHEYEDNKDLLQKVGIALIPYVSFVIYYLIIKLLLPTGDGYGSLFTTSLKTIVWLITRNGVILTEFFGNFDSKYASYEIVLLVFVACFLILCIYNMIRLRKQNTYFVFYVIITSLVLFVFNGLQGHRYLLPLFPFLLYFAYSSVKENRYVNGILMGMLCLMVLYNLVHGYYVQTKQIRTDEANAPQSQEVYAYIREHVKDEEGVYFMKPRALYLNTDVNAMIGDEATIEEVAKRVDWMLLYYDRAEWKVFHDYCVANHYTLEFSNEWFELYRVGDKHD